MNLRTMLAVCLLSLPAAQMHAIPSFQDVDVFAGNTVYKVAGWFDSIGAYFNLCKPPLKDALSHTAATAYVHAKNLNLSAAGEALADGAKGVLNQDLCEAPLTGLVGRHMTEAKIVLGVVVALVATIATKKIFFPKKSRKNKSQ